MVSSTVSNLDAALKQVYVANNYQISTYKKRPLLGMLPKNEKFGGRNMPLVNQFGNPQGISSNFGFAQANSTQMKVEDFVLTRKTIYAIADLEGELLEAADGTDEYAFLEALSAKIDAVMDGIMDVYETYLFRSGTGSIGVISGVTTGKTITLATPSDAHNFEPLMKVESAATETGAVYNSTGTHLTETVAGVNRKTGVLTATSAAWDTVITSISDADHLFRHGDAYDNDANKVVAGLAAWVPATAPGSSDDFFGVNRSQDSRLFGQYVNGSNGTIEEALITGAMDAGALGGAVDLFTLQHTDHRRLQYEMRDKEMIKRPAMGPNGAVAAIGYNAIRLAVPDAGEAAVVACNKQPGGTSFGLEMDTWALNSLGPIPKLLEGDGNMILRKSTSDDYEVRVGGRGELGCKKPGCNVQIGLPS